MSTGGKTVYAWSAKNVGLVNFQPGNVLILDIANSGSGIAAKLPTGTSQAPLGICIDKAKVDPNTQAVDEAQSIAFVDMGREWAIATGTIAVGDKVGTVTGGNVSTVARTVGGPVPILGTAETAASGTGQGVLVRLEIGGLW